MAWGAPVDAPRLYPWPMPRSPSAVVVAPVVLSRLMFFAEPDEFLLTVRRLFFDQVECFLRIFRNSKRTKL